MWQAQLRALSFVLTTLCGAAVACAGEAPHALTLSSPAFKSGAAIPAQCSCDGADQSPALSWRGAPAGAQRFALIVDDPDAPAGTWVHWVVYDLPADTAELPAGVAKDATLPNGAAQGVNDFHRVGYNGPCPPPGKAHRYVFTLYALDGPTGLQPRATKADVLRAITGHVLAHGELRGTYKH
jgi:Raf kinase inhibitor-like YbhB/YbcL family protein